MNIKKTLFNAITKALRFRHTAHTAANIANKKVNGVTISLCCNPDYSNWRINIEDQDCRVHINFKAIHVYNYR